jgi:predicted acylesterase/phospholipase RssA
MADERETMRVLSIDGGGIRGVIPAMILAELQKMVGATPLIDLFDLVAGTSTGGLIALGLTVPDEGGKPRYTPEDMVRLYTEDGKRIFSRGLWYRLTSLSGWLRPKYPATGIETVLREKFGSVQLKDALKDVVVTSYDIQNRKARLFSRAAARADPLSNYYMRDVARATSAAPTYFAPAAVMSLSGGDGVIAVDGGMAANNPTLLSVVTTMKAAPGKKMFIVSVGTGKVVRPFPTNEAMNWGLLGWAVPITNVIFDAQTNLVTEELGLLLPPAKAAQDPRYRFQASLDNASYQMDDTSPANMAELTDAAQDVIDGRKEDLQQVCELLLGSK